MNKARKRLFSLFLVMAMIISCVPNLAFAQDSNEETDSSYSSIGSHVVLNEDGSILKETEEKSKTIENVSNGNYIKMSKTIDETETENEYQIKLKVETTEKIEDIAVAKNADVVLVLDVSTSMDSTMDGEEPITSGKVNPNWTLSETRWTALKEAAKNFIEGLLLDSGNRVSIVVYGASKSTICDWTNDADEAIGKFYNYQVVTQNYAKSEYGVTNLISLRQDYFGDNANALGGTNCEAGFKGAIEQLTSSEQQTDNSRYVIYMSDGEANRSDTATKTAEQAAIDKAKELKTSFPDSILYTVGFSNDAANSNVLKKDTNTAVDEYHSAASAEELNKVYETINKQIKLLSQAWQVTDPMGSYVSLVDGSVSTTTNSDYSVSEDGTISWNLLNSECSDSYVEGELTINVYTLTYTITVDTQAEGFDWDTYYATNGVTTLTYIFTDDNSKLIEDSYGEEDFLIPTVKGHGTIIRKTASTSGIIAGDKYTYEITAQNNSENTWENVEATDELEDVLSYVGYTSDDGVTVNEEYGTLTIHFGDIAVGKTKTVKIEVQVKEDTEVDTVIRNKVVTSNGEEYEDPVEPKVILPNISKKASVTEIQAGEKYTYTITAANNSDYTWYAVEAKDKLEDALDYVGFTSDDEVDVAVEEGSGILRINFGDIAPGKYKTVTIEVQVKADTKAGTEITNTVVIPVEGDDDIIGEDPVKPKVIEPGLSATKISDCGDTTYVGDNISYTIEVENVGNAIAYDVVVNDKLPTGVKLIDNSVTVNGEATSDYTQEDGMLSVAVGNIEKGKTATITFQVNVTSEAAGQIIENTGTATGYSKEEHGDTPDLKDDFTDGNTNEVKNKFIDDHVAYIIGYPDDTVNPKGEISRAESITVVFRLLVDEYRDQYWTKTNSYGDVADDAWYNNAISTMTNAGIIEGYSNGDFGPDDYITRADLAIILARFYSDTYDGADLFPDISGHYAQEYINRAAASGWVEGYTDGTFRPDEYITRAETMTMVNRVLGRDKVQEMHKDMKIWSDNADSTEWYYIDVQEATNTHNCTLTAEGYEIWTEILPNRDWAALEKTWSEANDK